MLIAKSTSFWAVQKNYWQNLRHFLKYFTVLKIRLQIGFSPIVLRFQKQQITRMTINDAFFYNTDCPFLTYFCYYCAGLARKKSRLLVLLRKIYCIFFIDGDIFGVPTEHWTKWMLIVYWILRITNRYVIIHWE